MTGSLQRRIAALLALAGSLALLAGAGGTSSAAPPAAPSISALDPSGPTVTLTITSAGASTFECSLDGGAYEPCSATPTYEDLAAGSHTITVLAFNGLGQQSLPGSLAWTVIVDTTPPDAPTITSAPADPGTEATPSVEWTGEPGGSFECALDGGAWTPCASPLALGPLTDGLHTWSVRQTDDAANVGAASTITWTLDTTAPAAPTLETAPAGSTTATSATFAWTGEPGGSFECALDGGSWSPCTSPHTATGFALGAHTWSVRQTDAVGHTGTAATHAWTVVAPLAPDPAPAPEARDSEPQSPPRSVPVRVEAREPLEVAGRVPREEGYVNTREVSVSLPTRPRDDLVLLAIAGRDPIAVRVEQRPDGSFGFDVPDEVEGEVELYAVGPGGEVTLRTTFVVDTRAPSVVEAVVVPRPATAPPPFRTDVPPTRRFFRLVGRDGGSGIKALQLSPRPGVTWAWRPFIERFSAPVRGDSIDVRVLDRAGNVSPWFTVPVARR
jgi:hypothetical protein